MTVNSADITSGPYAGNGVADSFSYDFRIENKNQLYVWETDDNGVQTLLTVDTDYTVTGVDNDAGGTVTRVAGALPSGYEWYIRSKYPSTQDTNFSSQGGFFPAIHEEAFDKLTYLVQQLDDQLGRTVRIPLGDGTGSLTEISELAADRADMFLKFDTNGDAALSDFSFADSHTPTNVTIDLIYTDGPGPSFTIDAATESAAGVMTAADKTIVLNAYDSFTGTGVTPSSTTLSLSTTFEDNAGAGGDILTFNLPAATTSAAGVMTAADKTTLDSLQAGVTTDLSATYAAGTVTIESSSGNNVTVAAATTSAAGVMTAADKTKLNDTETGFVFAESFTATDATFDLNFDSGPGPGFTIDAATESAAGLMTAADKTIVLNAYDSFTGTGVTPGASSLSLSTTFNDNAGAGGDILTFNLPAATETDAGVMTAADKTIVLNAYDSFTGTGVTPSSTTVSLSTTFNDNAGAGGDILTFNIPSATTSLAGAMSAADKTKLDGVTAGAGSTDLSATYAAGTVTIESSSGNDVVVAAATETDAGVMTAADKTIVLNAYDSFTGTGVTPSSTTVSLSTTFNDNAGAGGDILTFNIPAATTSDAGVMSAADKTKLDGVTAGAGSTDLSATYAAGTVTIESSSGNDVVVAAATETDAGVMTAADKTIVLNAYDSFTGTGVTPGASSLSLSTTFNDNAGAGGDILTFNVPMATTSLAGAMSAADKTKLDSVESGAEANDPTNLGRSDGATSFTITSSTGTNVTVPGATTSFSGAMVASDKVKLNGIEAGAEANDPTNINITRTSTTVDVESSTGSNGTIAAATTSNAGVMSAADKTNLLNAYDSFTGVGVTPSSTTISLSATFNDNAGAGGDILTFNIPAATTSLAGAMVASDKSKLNGIESGAEANDPTNLGNSRNSTSVTVTSSTGSNTTLSAATEANAGVMTAADKTIVLNAYDSFTGVGVTPSSTSVSLSATFQDNAGAGGDILTFNLPAATTSNAGVMTADDKTKVNQVLGLRNFSSSFTLGDSDNGKTLFKDTASALTVTVPTDGAANLPIGFRVEIINDNAATGNITVSRSAGVTMQGLKYDGFSTGDTSSATLANGAAAVLTKVGANNWFIRGELGGF